MLQFSTTAISGKCTCSFQPLDRFFINYMYITHYKRQLRFRSPLIKGNFDFVLRFVNPLNVQRQTLLNFDLPWSVFHTVRKKIQDLWI